MNKKKLIISCIIVIILLSLGVYLFLNNKNEVNDKNMNQSTSQFPIKGIDGNSNEMLVKENQYYIVYIQKNNGTGSSFIPLTLNPGFEEGSDYGVSISFDDNGKIINDNKIIIIDNFLISNKNKEMIKKVAGKDKYKEALKEIEERVIEAKKGLEN
ncbi:hypothetical protein PDK42_19705 [Bacillus cereus group sp. TH172LC]|uniref:hypothetical protein n=1 Tax=unclassified Bacillus cereus group TaxID=2750818 RepID=UPI0022DF7353|nr:MULTISPECIES: hypothetical protein [unclassified Bacillus cereus group]MDA1629924.1 hypothetical protein [Bacillus cereus group sp. TH172LC]MDA1833846.1 hypothetical protein [Bacillus cereus group sp. BY142LC]